MGSLVLLAQASQLTPRPGTALPAAPRQLALVLDGVRLQSMTAAQRQAVVKALAQLLLEASGVVAEEAGDDDA